MINLRDVFFIFLGATLTFFAPQVTPLIESAFKKEKVLTTAPEPSLQKMFQEAQVLKDTEVFNVINGLYEGQVKFFEDSFVHNLDIETYFMEGEGGLITGVFESVMGVEESEVSRYRVEGENRSIMKYNDEIIVKIATHLYLIYDLNSSSAAGDLVQGGEFYKVVGSYSMEKTAN